MSSNNSLKKDYGISCFSKNINIERKISLINDFKSIIQLYKFLKIKNFDLVLSVSPKAGLITSLSSFFAKTKYRVHFFTGQVWVTKKGIFRFILKSIDRLIAKLNTSSLVDSPSQRKFLIKENVISPYKTSVLLNGSISGVDIKKFTYNNDTYTKLQKKYMITEKDMVFMFLGRLNIDKGVLDLVKVFQDILMKYSHVKLFLIGPDEENMTEKILDFINHENVIRIDYVSNPEEILNIANVLVLPSYREGFGTIVIEAASMGIPSIASDIYGLKDAIINNSTGLLHIKKDLTDMKKKYEFAINNDKVMKQFSKNAQKRIHQEFQDKFISKELKKYIDKLLSTKE
jgi:glycosyltransferase involved in cell wall biosynthesis